MGVVTLTPPDIGIGIDFSLDDVAESIINVEIGQAYEVRGRAVPGTGTIQVAVINNSNNVYPGVQLLSSNESFAIQFTPIEATVRLQIGSASGTGWQIRDFDIRRM